MPALFARELCGYRANGNPNTSDNNDVGSKVLGAALFEALGVSPEQAGPDDAGAALESSIHRDLAELRPDLQIDRSRPIFSFEQYGHLAVFPSFRKSHVAAASALDRLDSVVMDLFAGTGNVILEAELARARHELVVQDELVAALTAQMPEEAMLKVDITVGEATAALPLLQVGLSSKWSLRTDRAQDCISQGTKLVAQRRGRMPHYAVVTMEPRPAMLKILCDGSGSVDCVYHLDLPALTAAMEAVATTKKSADSWSPMRTFRRLVEQRRLRDYDELREEVRRIPARTAAE